MTRTRIFRLPPIGRIDPRDIIATGPIPLDADDLAFDCEMARRWAASNAELERILRLVSESPIFGGTMPADDGQADAVTAIPDVSGLDTAQAALDYAEAGMYLVPTSADDIKNPGSILGKKWQDQSSHDPDQIRQWWFDHPNAGIALDVGRSGLIAFDMDEDLDDKPADMTDEVWDALQTGAVHATRRPGCGKDARAHYVFACKPDEFGNGAGAFGRWGQVRCSNGVIVLAPTPHPDADTKGGSYRWRKFGELPPLPDVLRGLLSSAARNHDPNTPAELTTFLGAHIRADQPHGLQGHLTSFATAVGCGESRHDTMTKVMVWAFRESMIGRFGAQTAYDALKYAFYQAKPETKGTGEFDRIARWAAAQAENADPSETRQRVNRDTYADPFDSIRSDLAAFWSSSPQLSDLRQFAQSRLVGPMSMLGNSLARVVASIPPNVVLPPIVGSYASLNLFVALVGKSGESKSASMRASADWLRIEPNYQPSKPGSGEGLAKCFAYPSKLAGGGGWVQVGKQWSVLAQIPEVDTLAATGNRSGSTIMSALREGWSGERLGQDYAGDDKRIILQDNRYRLCLSLGVQPLRATPIFDDADGGTPQRFVWFSAVDHDLPDVEPDAPSVLDLGRWENGTSGTHSAALVDPDIDRNANLAVPADPAEFDVLTVPAIAEREIRDVQRAIRRGLGGVDPLDGHRLLVQLKVAAALMALEGRRHEITDSDWQRAAVVMAMSNITRKAVRDELASKSRELNLARGRAEGEREIIKSDVIAEDRQRVFRMSERIREALKADDGQTLSKLRKALAGGNRNRDVFDKAVVFAASNGMVRREDFTATNGQESARLWLV
ncbi:bifunctional DNA primase/polymerase [Mycolicibacterium confluentis]|uniref:bifunctional DNA primase/polymerase n=1 Tax=Mycolicibacterium confluentis TaxID=28047 RepID=UPI0013D36049|nr:bifunctional DNA primase/polymerase [Mycolicibacterium confluentis]MCV7317833.1 bifunctional DNA primase/polymerase [Mycolicibacterium confluentis]